MSLEIIKSNCEKAIAYVRVSTTDQAQNNLSLQGQQEAIKRYYDEKRYTYLKHLSSLERLQKRWIGSNGLRQWNIAVPM